MRRRDFLAAAAGAPLLAPAAESRPNILFILADDLGYGDLGCYGQQKIATPNLDRLAAEGTRFTQSYAGSTVCAPSRCCLMTGKHTGHATVRGNVKPELGLRQGDPTVASLLKGAGYETALFGKWGLGGPGTPSMPRTAGFDEFFGYLDQQHAHNYYPDHLWDNENEYFLTENWFGRKKTYAPGLFTERALKFLARKRNKPFFLHFTPTLPHADNELGAYTGNGMEVPTDEPYSARQWPPVERNFAAMVTRLDSDVGRVLAALRGSGQERDTLVIFSSDNGPHREGGHDPDFFQSRGPLRGIKRDLYEGGIRTPFIARWPGRVPAGHTSSEVIAFWDFLPTACALAGVKPPAGGDGVSIVRALEGASMGPRPPLYWEFHEGRFSQAVRREEWKAVRPNRGQPVELYRLTGDAGETHDIASAHTARLNEMQDLMRTLRSDSPEFPV